MTDTLAYDTLNEMENNTDNRNIHLRELYPNRSDEELAKARRNLTQYLSVIVRIYERLCQNPEAYREFRRLTGKVEDDAMDTERSINDNQGNTRDA